MYILPQPYTCDKCGHQSEYTPHVKHAAPTFESGPICVACFEKFIRSSCGTISYNGRSFKGEK